MENEMTTEQDLTKTVRLGTIPTHDGAKVSVYASVEYADGRLSITGVEGPRSGGNCYGSCGQISMSYRTAEERDVIALAPGWTRDMLDHFFAVWEKWHLNDMQAGSPAQTAILGTDRASEELKSVKYPDSHYDACKRILGREGFDPDPSYLVDGEPYSYGSRWLKVDVPREVLAFLRDEIPSADRKPAWV